MSRLENSRFRHGLLSPASVTQQVIAWNALTFEYGLPVSQQRRNRNIRFELTIPPLVIGYQASPHSSGYYHVAATYWANGAVNTLNSGLAGLPTWTYGVDGEGRPYSASASSGTNPVTSTLYNGFSLPTSVIYPVPWLGRAQNDTFSYDGNTGRMTQYQTGASSYSGALTWNANGTLANLATSYPAQTCNYVHDDLTRLASVACAASPSGWNQTFGYDAFGNISKTGSGLGVSFQPTYSTATNRYTALPSGTPSYDANGNLNADGYHSYAWDADGNLTSLDGATTMVYDAFDRRVEETNSGTTTEILYGASGAKFAVLSGGTLIRLMTPLPGGGTGIYSGTAPSFYYMHPDWLGSVRAILGTGGGLLYDGAYAPYGEIYSPVGPPGYPGVFTGQNQDLAGDLYDFPAREYHPVQGRWVQPDPAGMAAVDFTNPQSWNRHGYALGSPLNSVDPSGMSSYWSAPPGSNCEYLASSSSPVCTSPFSNQFWSGGLPSLMPTDNTIAYQQYAALMNTVFWRGVAVGFASQQGGVGGLATLSAQLSQLSGLSISLASVRDTADSEPYYTATVDGGPSNDAPVLPATQAQYQKAFTQGYSAALGALKRKSCSAFYGGQGPGTMSATSYSFLDFGAGKTAVGAQTNSQFGVFVNPTGPYVTFVPTPVQAGPFGVNWLTQARFQAFILLHELGHQLSSTTGFQEDAGNPLNAAQSRRVIANCF